MSLDAFIVDAIRLPRGKGKVGGSLHGLRPVELGAILLRSLEARSELDTARVDDLILGCVTQVGDQGANIAKTTALYAGWSEAVPGMTVNRYCCSSIDALGLAAARLASGTAQAIVAGGVESVSRVPMLSDKGAWFADPVVAKKTGFVHMPEAADLMASVEGIEKEALDAYAARSHQRAAHATENGAFQSIVPAIDDGGTIVLDRDELIRPKSTAEAFASLPALLEDAPPSAVIADRFPAQAFEHRHSIASAPGLADGASALLLMTRSHAESCALKPKAVIRSYATHSVEPVQMLHGNVGAAAKALAQAGLSVADVDAFEVNESFAVVPLHFQRSLDLAPEKLNAWGGAIAMGHPLGATGGILLATLLDRLQAEGGTIGLASICGGAGVASSVVVERL